MSMESILSARDRMTLENGMQLRLLSALETLQARREAKELAADDRERAQRIDELVNALGRLL